MCFKVVLEKNNQKHMQKNHLKKLFKLEEYILDKIEYLNEEILLFCHIQARYMFFNGERSKCVNSIRKRKIPHMMLENQLVFLIVEQRRFHFPLQKKRLWEMLPGVGRRKQTTNTFRLHTLRELQRDNYSGSGKKRHKSPMFPMKLLDNLPIEFKWRKGIKTIGMDGKGVKKGKLIHHLVDLEQGKSICVMPGESQFLFKKNSWKLMKTIEIMYLKSVQIWMNTT